MGQEQTGVDVPSDLDGRRIGPFTILLRNARPGRARGEVRFDLNLRDMQRKVYEPAVVSALHFSGIGKWYRPWIEVNYENQVASDGIAIDLEGGPEEEELFGLLCGLLPPGSHIMVKYHNHPVTAMALLFGVPPAATPIGYLLYRGGCRWYKDWYFAEGFLEGEEKLQATKPLDVERNRAKTLEIREQLKAYLRKEPDPTKPEMESVCRKLAARILDMPEA